MSAPTFGLPLTRRSALRQLATVVGGLKISGVFGADSRSWAQGAPEIKSQPLTAGLVLITGAGGNILAHHGPDGVLTVDSGLAPVSAGTLAKVNEAAPGRLVLAVNTHWHFDHVGGNERFAAAGARIVATENARQRMSTEQFTEFFDKTSAPLPVSAQPSITFNGPSFLRLNGETVRLTPLPPAHTDGDLAVYFDGANVLHMGDVFFHGAYPYIDYSSGGWIGGMAAAVRSILPALNGSVKIVPGHGPVATLEDFKQYLGFLEAAQEKLTKYKAAGKSVDEVVAEAPFKEHDAKLGNGFMKPEPFVRNTYAGLLKHP